MNRRNLLKTSLLSGAALLTLPKLANANSACSAKKTPPQVKGPFYPVVDQVDTDADLIQVQGAHDIAKGFIVLIEGTVTNQHCQPVAGVLVEIWQACETGRYNHPVDPNPAELDPNFQYWGKALTDKNGFYRFRTIIPGAYPADSNWMRPPHIHFKVAKLGYTELITQMYFAGESLNAQDKILMQLPLREREKVVVNFETHPELPHPRGVFDIGILKIE